MSRSIKRIQKDLEKIGKDLYHSFCRGSKDCGLCPMNIHNDCKLVRINEIEEDLGIVMERITKELNEG